MSRQVGILLYHQLPIGVANLQGRWSFDGENANDLSGKTRHGTAKKLFSPSGVSGMKLWLDASDLTTAGPTWSDKSGNLNHAIKNGSPTISTYNGKSVMRYSGSNGEYHSWTKWMIFAPFFGWFERKVQTATVFFWEIGREAVMKEVTTSTPMVPICLRTGVVHTVLRQIRMVLKLLTLGPYRYLPV